jgi:hypothetical protein
MKDADGDERDGQRKVVQVNAAASTQHGSVADFVPHLSALVPTT